jgi:hypothetical protein
MIILNFSHPLTVEQQAQIEALTGQKVETMIAVPVQFDNEESFLPQLQELMAKKTLTSEEFQTKQILVNPPSLNVISALLLAELHGRMGYFPPILRLRPVSGVIPPRFEAAEILNLQTVRDAARTKRLNNDKKE